MSKRIVILFPVLIGVALASYGMRARVFHAAPAHPVVPDSVQQVAVASPAAAEPAPPATRPVSLMVPALPLHGDLLGYPDQTIDRLAIRQLLLSRSFGALDTLLTAYADSAARDYRYEYRLFDAYAGFDVALPSLKDPLSEWVQQQPQSSPALLARATFLSALAWHARGGKFVNETPQGQLHTMRDFFELAATDLVAAQRITPNSLVAYRLFLQMAMTAGDRVACRALLDRALTVQPYSFLLRANYMNSLLPRWGGSYEAMARFADESAPFADRNPRIRALQGFADADRADVLEDNGEKAQAVEGYGRAIGYADFWDFRLQRGMLYNKAERNEEALDDLNAVIAQYPQNADALYWRSMVEYELGAKMSDERSRGLHSRAFEDIALAVALDPNDRYYRKQLAFLRENVSEFEPPSLVGQGIR